MAERKRLGVLTIKQNLFGKVYEFSVPEKEWVRLSPDEGNYVGYWEPGTNKKTEAALNQEKWIREHPEAFKLRNFGIKYGLGEGATLAHGGDIAALLKNAPGAISSIIGRDYEKGDYAQSVK